MSGWRPTTGGRVVSSSLILSEMLKGSKSGCGAVTDSSGARPNLCSVRRSEASSVDDSQQLTENQVLTGLV